VGKKQLIDMKPYATIAALKQFISHKCNVVVKRLIFAGKVLSKDSETLGRWSHVADAQEERERERGKRG